MAYLLAHETDDDEGALGNPLVERARVATPNRSDTLRATLYWTAQTMSTCPSQEGNGV